jgi:hypothetical protein
VLREPCCLRGEEKHLPAVRGAPPAISRRWEHAYAAKPPFRPWLDAVYAATGRLGNMLRHRGERSTTLCHNRSGNRAVINRSVTHTTRPTRCHQFGKLYAVRCTLYEFPMAALPSTNRFPGPMDSHISFLSWLQRTAAVECALGRVGVLSPATR